MTTSELLKPHEVEDAYGITAKSLSNMRYRSDGPRYLKTKPGRSGRVLYRKTDIEEWLDSLAVATNLRTSRQLMG